MRTFNTKKNNGFVLLFAIIVTSIILTVSFGISNISLQELNFSTSAKETNEAFYAADVGAECALMNDKVSSTTFLPSGGLGYVECLGEQVSLETNSATTWSFKLIGLGTSEQSCATILVTKDFSTNPVTTFIDSKGYNKGDNECEFSATRIERNIKVTYGGQATETGVRLIASPTTVDAGETVTVSFSGVSNPTVDDYIGRFLASAGNPTQEQDFGYTSGSPTCTHSPGGSPSAAGSCSFVMPSTPENYNFRLFTDDGGTDRLVATSNTVTVTSPSADYTLTVERIGTGSGLVTGQGDINCGAVCNDTFGAGGTDTLTATANPGSTFTGWSGCTTAAGDTCQVTMNGDQTVTATFTTNSVITFVGSSSAVGTTVPLPAHQAGDLIIIFAFRESNTPPSIDPAWTPIGSSDTGNVTSTVMGYKVASSSGTTSGTWSGATLLAANVYRGQKATNPIGDKNNLGQAVATITYPALPGLVTTNTSWVVGFAGHRSVDTNIQNAPTGMVNRTNLVGGAAEISSHDTAGTVSSWGAPFYSSGGTVSGWRTRTVEILAQ